MSISIFSRTCSGPEILEAKENGSVQIGGGRASTDSETAFAALGRKSPQIYFTSLSSSGWHS